MITEGNEEDREEIWQSKLKEVEQGIAVRPKQVPLKQLPKQYSTPLTLAQQFDFLGEIPNSHYDRYLKVCKNEVCQKNPSLLHMLLYSPKHAQTKNNNDAPTSFRQRSLYFLHLTESKRPFDSYVHRCIIERITKPEGQKPYRMSSQSTPQVKRRRNRTNQEPDIQISPGPSPEPVANKYSKEKQYALFVQYMFDYGTIIVRSHSSAGGFLIMNRYLESSGRVQAEMFVNIRYIHEPDRDVEIKCSCNDFQTSGGEGGRAMDPEQKWLSHRLKCMHVRFLYDHLEEPIKNIPDVPISEHEKIQVLTQQMHDTSITQANSKVVVISNTNFLIMSVTLNVRDMPSVVSFNPSTYETTCHGSCILKASLKLDRKYWLDEEPLSPELACPHIRKVADEEILIESFLALRGHTKKKRKKKKKKEYFCTRLKKWISASLLKHKPKAQTDPIYNRYTKFITKQSREYICDKSASFRAYQSRYKYHDLADGCSRDAEGFLLGPKFIPDLKEGTICKCGVSHVPIPEIMKLFARYFIGMSNISQLAYDTSKAVRSRMTKFFTYTVSSLQKRGTF